MDTSPPVEEGNHGPRNGVEVEAVERFHIGRVAIPCIPIAAPSEALPVRKAVADICLQVEFVHTLHDILREAAGLPLGRHP